MTDFQLVDPQGWEWDLQSVYSAYMNHFQLHCVPWYDRTWGHLFSTFEAFLSFGWPVICVTDSLTGRPHIVTRTNSIDAFLKMIKTRFGENLPAADNMLRVTPFEKQSRHLRTVTDGSSYKKLFSTLAASILSAQKLRIRYGEPKCLQALWEKRDKTLLAIDFKWSERNKNSCLEWGYAAVRCGHLDAMGIWPPVPETNYRRGHYVVAEYIDKMHNRYSPTFPREYAFGESQIIPKSKLGEVIQANLSSFATPDSESIPNQLVLVTYGNSGDLERLAHFKVKLPNNILVVDAAAFERQLFSKGLRGAMVDAQSNKPRQSGTTLSLGNTLRSLNADLGCTWNCSGNDAFGALLALQLLLDREGTQVPRRRSRSRSRSIAPGRARVYAGPGQLVSKSSLSSLLTPPPSFSGNFDGRVQTLDGQQRKARGRSVQSRREQNDETGLVAVRTQARRLSASNGAVTGLPA